MAKRIKPNRPAMINAALPQAQQAQPDCNGHSTPWLTSR